MLFQLDGLVVAAIACESLKRLSNRSSRAFTVSRVAVDSIRRASCSNGIDLTHSSLIFKASKAFAKVNVVPFSLRNRLQHLNCNNFSG